MSLKQPIVKGGRKTVVKKVVGVHLPLLPPDTLAAAVDETSGGIELTASEVSGADSYSYYYAIAGGAWQSLATGQTTSYTFVPTQSGEYAFGVTAVKGSAESRMTTLVPDSLFDDVPNAEGFALMAFYEATNGDAWGTNTNWLTDSTVGNWYGVTVSGGSVDTVYISDVAFTDIPQDTLDAFPELTFLSHNLKAVFETKKLRASAATCMTVRRSSDDTEADIGFDNSGNLDETALLAHCGAGDGFIAKWWDQSGNAAHAEQATNADQPKIVSTGAVLSGPQFDAANTYFEISNIDCPAIFNNVDFHISAYAYPATHDISQSFLAGEESSNAGNADYWWSMGLTSTNYLTAQFDDDVTKVFMAATDAEMPLDTWAFCSAEHDEGADYELFLDNTSKAIDSDNGAIAETGHSLYIGCDGRNNNFFSGKIKSVYLYSRLLTANEKTHLKNITEA